MFEASEPRVYMTIYVSSSSSDILFCIILDLLSEQVSYNNVLRAFAVKSSNRRNHQISRFFTKTRMQQALYCYSKSTDCQNASSLQRSRFHSSLIIFPFFISFSRVGRTNCLRLFPVVEEVKVDRGEVGRRGSSGSWLGFARGEAGEQVGSGDRRNGGAGCYKCGDPRLGIRVPVDLKAEDVFFGRSFIFSGRRR
jgi:hypothetical protein